ncbi:hypothetical protein [Streptomyces albidoflavus]|uniref:hypothetical protein n=1 Tax=Streptomyces albidoflavus TaxID=1886 RepID=UPI0033CDC916
MLEKTREGWALLPTGRRRLITGGALTGTAGTAACLTLGAGPGGAFLLAAVTGVATSALLLATTTRPAPPPSAEVRTHAAAGTAGPGYSRWHWTLTLEAPADQPQILHGESERLNDPHATRETVLHGILAELATRPSTETSPPTTWNDRRGTSERRRCSLTSYSMTKMRRSEEWTRDSLR